MSVTVPEGFTAAGIAAGIKPDGAHDLTVVSADRTATAAGVFTVNRFAAAPVMISRQHLAASQTARAVVINSGCANAGTGDAGLEASRMMAETAAGDLGCSREEVLVCSTGTIGTTLPMDVVERGIHAAIRRLGRGEVVDDTAARGIMTTDSVPKQAVARGAGFSVGGIAKGAGMVRPDMATMLVVITSDAVADRPTLDAALRSAVDSSFHELNIDGCPSTNDTVIALASGASGVAPDLEELAAVLGSVARHLAEQLAADAEGATRVVTLDVAGAADDATARKMGRAIADSALVRAAFYGGDPNWGRLAGALGAADYGFDPAALEVSFAGVVVLRGGVHADHDEASLLAALAKGDFLVNIHVGDGAGQASVLTTDLTPAYVEFNGKRS